MKKSVYSCYIKRLLDFLVSFTALLILSPILLILTVVGAVAMKGNPFFTQRRPGRIDRETGKERIFSLVKFRTMSNAKDASGKLLPDAQRVNAYGKALRASSLDELPELFNILIGDMSIVGPRPLLVEYLDYYSDFEHNRHTVRPGLTGLAQVSGRNGLTWESRFRLDNEYVESVSFLGDVKILFLTVKKVLVREGIEYRSTETFKDYIKNKSEKVNV